MPIEQIQRPEGMSNADWEKYLLVGHKLGLPESRSEISMIYFRAGIEMAKYTFHSEDDEIAMTVEK